VCYEVKKVQLGMSGGFLVNAVAPHPAKHFSDRDFRGPDYPHQPHPIRTLIKAAQGAVAVALS